MQFKIAIFLIILYIYFKMEFIPELAAAVSLECHMII